MRNSVSLHSVLHHCMAGIYLNIVTDDVTAKNVLFLVKYCMGVSFSFKFFNLEV